MLAERIQFVTGNFYQLQGLRLVPLGLFFLYGAASSRGWFDWLPGMPVDGPGDLGNAWTILFWVGILTVAWSVEARYRGFGTVVQFPRTRRNTYIAVAIAAFLCGVALDIVIGFPVRLGQLVLAVSLLVVVYADGRFRQHYLVSAMAWLAVAATPLFDVSADQMKFATTLCAGITLIICGVGDHLLLVRTFLPRGKRLDVSKSVTV
jgi:hypothetical protein